MFAGTSCDSESGFTGKTTAKSNADSQTVVTENTNTPAGTPASIPGPNQTLPQDPSQVTADISDSAVNPIRNRAPIVPVASNIDASMIQADNLCRGLSPHVLVPFRAEAMWKYVIFPYSFPNDPSPLSSLPERTLLGDAPFGSGYDEVTKWGGCISQWKGSSQKLAF